MAARQKAKAVPVAGRKTKVKNRGRQKPIIDEFDPQGNPVPMNRYQSTVTKANNVGPFIQGRIRGYSGVQSLLSYRCEASR